MTADLSRQRMDLLISDLEAVRIHLGIEQWTILGVSWGTTLALAYAHAHPERVRKLVLALVTTTSRSEVAWITEGVGRLFPEQWDRFVEAVPASLRHLPLVDAYATLLADPETAENAGQSWCEWEDTHVSLSPGFAPYPRFQEPDFRLRFARLVTHYWRHAAFLPENFLIEQAHRLNGIPGVLIHGRYDVSSPLEVPYRLSKKWKTSRLQILDDMGHGNGDSFPRAVTAALLEPGPAAGELDSGRFWRNRC